MCWRGRAPAPPRRPRRGTPEEGRLSWGAPGARPAAGGGYPAPPDRGPRHPSAPRGHPGTSHGCVPPALPGRRAHRRGLGRRRLGRLERGTPLGPRVLCGRSVTPRQGNPPLSPDAGRRPRRLDPDAPPARRLEGAGGPRAARGSRPGVAAAPPEPPAARGAPPPTEPLPPRRARARARARRAGPARRQGRGDRAATAGGRGPARGLPRGGRRGGARHRPCQETAGQEPDQENGPRCGSRDAEARAVHPLPLIVEDPRGGRRGRRPPPGRLAPGPAAGGARGAPGSWPRPLARGRRGLRPPGDVLDGRAARAPTGRPGPRGGGPPGRCGAGGG